MPVNGMNVGVDYSFGLFDTNTNALLNLGDVQNVRMAADKHDISSMPYNGVPRFGYIPNGYTFTFSITRTNAVMEDLQIVLAAQFEAGGIMQPGYLNMSVTNPDGTTRRYQYTQCVFFLTDPGDVSRETVVKQTVQGKASDKVRIA